MIKKRIIPVLLLKNMGLYKGIHFKNYVYIGDPINAVKIFNDMDVDELVFLDIECSQKKGTIDLNFVKNLAEECFMPFSVGGGIDSLDKASQIFKAGAEKVILNTKAVENPDLISQISKNYGSQSVVVSIDVKKNWLGKYCLYVYSGGKQVNCNLIEWVRKAEQLGAGEILLNSIDQDGTMKGYDINLINWVAKEVKIPVIACGGAGHVRDFKSAIDAGADACAAGSMFVFHGPRKGILINYPEKSELNNLFKQ
ncbi:MAG: AglZ/HisF2 family acetamidino modification protein [Bacteroidales bacterium]|nr:AglZ/HisF2 family acetamidino modification protein [Bacteroidales bacterium]